MKRPMSYLAYESKSSKYATRHVVQSRSLIFTNTDGWESLSRTNLSKQKEYIRETCTYLKACLRSAKYCTTGIAPIAKPSPRDSETSPVVTYPMMSICGGLISPS